jgi:hypothetical protein
MTKTKISATVDPARLEQAREVTGTNSLSRLLDDALVALIERSLEQRWLDAHTDGDLPGEVPVDLSSIPWNSR